MKKAYQIPILVCVIAALVLVVSEPLSVIVATIFAAVITGVTATVQAGQVIHQLAGDAVAITISNHFRYVTLVREDMYIYDGEEYVTPAMTVAPGAKGCAGGYDDGYWNAGGVAGGVRYSMMDTQANIKYCMDIFYTNDQGEFGDYDGWLVAVGRILCSKSLQSNFNEWKKDYKFFMSSAQGKGTVFQGTIWASYGTAGNNGYPTCGNNDYKISWKVDMNAQSVATIDVEVGPYNWWIKGDSRFEGVVPVPDLPVDTDDHQLHRLRQPWWKRRPRPSWFVTDLAILGDILALACVLLYCMVYAFRKVKARNAAQAPKYLETNQTVPSDEETDNEVVAKLKIEV